MKTRLGCKIAHKWVKSDGTKRDGHSNEICLRCSMRRDYVGTLGHGCYGAPYRLQSAEEVLWGALQAEKDVDRVMMFRREYLVEPFEDVRSATMACQRCGGRWVSPENLERVIKERDAAFYNGIEWLACWLLDNSEGEEITEEKLRPWAVKAWAAHVSKRSNSTMKKIEKL